MTVLIVPTMTSGIPLILAELRAYPAIEVFDESQHIGYFADLKPAPKPVNELLPHELARELRKHYHPQPYDVTLREWPAWMYRGFTL